MHDVIIIGGSYAGMAAALQLGRARRSVLVLDGGHRRNRFASHAHGFLGHDGQSPEAIAVKGRTEVLAYPTVEWRDAVVRQTAADAGEFIVRTEDQEYRSKRLILATGVGDELPSIPGLRERWGQTVFHCPYCHGYELNKPPLGVLGTNPLSVHHAVLVSEWAAANQMTLFLNGAFEPDTDQLADLQARGISVERERVIRAGGDAPSIDLTLQDGRTTRLEGLFVVPQTVLENPFAKQLGCALEDGPVGQYYKTDLTKETTVPGVFACGDAALAMGSVSFAVADGAMAGVATHRSLVFRR
jgi:thioredoxin reductase